MRSLAFGWVVCGSWLLGGVSGAQAETASTRMTEVPAPALVKRFSHWGYAHRHYRHRAGPLFKGPNADQGFYDFLVRLPLFKSSIKPTDRPPMVIVLHARRGDFERHEKRWSDHVVLTPDDNTAGVGHTGWFGYHELAPVPPKPDTVVVPYTHRRLVYTIRFVVKEFHVDVHRIWIRGGSMGGGGALLFALHHPEWIAGVVADHPPIDMRALPAFRPVVAKLFGPMQWNLKVAGTDVGVWRYTSVPWLLSRRSGCRTWLEIRHGRADRVVPFAQYYTSISPPGRSFVQLFERGAAPGTFVWDMSAHGRGDPIGAWRSDFSHLSNGLVRTDRPTFAFSEPSLGHLGVPQKLGQWRAGQRPERDPRGLMNAFCRWDANGLVDRPDRLEVDLWLSGDGSPWQHCPVETMAYDVSPRGTQRFPIPPGCTFAYRVDPDGPTGRAPADEHGVLTIPQVPLPRGRDHAVKLRIQHAMPVPVVQVSSPTHPTPVPRAPTTVVVRWTVANSSTRDPMPVDRYACWLAREPSSAAPPKSETWKTERVFESLEPGRYYVMVQARLVTGRWGPVTSRVVNVDSP